MITTPRKNRMIKKKFYTLCMFGLLGFGPIAHSAHAALSENTPPAYVDKVTKLVFPAKLGPFNYARVVEYEDKDLGYCVLYSADRDYGQICVYDMGKKDIPIGIASPEFKEALRIAVEGTLGAFNTAPYHDGKMIAEATPGVESETNKAEAEVRIFASKLKLPDGTEQNNSHLVLMTAGFGKFIKFNYTAKNLNGDEFGERTKEVVVAFVKANSTIMKTLLIERKK